MTDSLRALFEQIVAELPPKLATLEVRHTRNDDGFIFELLPAKEGCAPIMVHKDDEVELVDFSFGGSGTWELPYEGRYKSADSSNVLPEVEQLIRAVVAGHCEIKHRLISVVSAVYVETYTYRVVDVLRFSFPPFTTRRYKPYRSE